MTVDDEPLIRSALRSILHTDGEIRVVADCTGRETLSAVKRHRPHVLLMDGRTSGGQGGLHILGELKSLVQSPATLVMTNSTSEKHLLEAFAAGALGYLLKDSSPQQFINAVHRAAAGEGTVSDAVAPSVIDGYRRFAQICTATARESERVKHLSSREREVLSLSGNGLSNREIAEHLMVSAETVKTHMSTILSKLNTTSRVRAALIAERTGLLSTSSWPANPYGSSRHRTNSHRTNSMTVEPVR